MLQPSANSSNPINLSEIKTEFGGASTLYGYRKGGGLVPAHINNSAVSATQPQNLQFVGASLPFDSSGGTTWTSGSSYAQTITGGGGYTNTVTDTYYGVSATTYFPGPSPTNPGTSFGTRGSYYTVGLGFSTTSTTNIVGAYDWYKDRVQNPGGTGNYSYYNGNYLVFSGNNTGTWWTSVTVNGTTKNRSATIAPNGTYNSAFGVTYWVWAGGNPGGLPFFNVTNPSIKVTL